MDITNFKNKWLGRSVDFDNAYGSQCVDLIKQYLYEVYGINPGSWGNAINYWSSTNPVLLQRFSRLDTQEPQQGDIVVFRTLGRSDLSGEGHIGISTGTNTNTQVAVLEQNGSTGNGSGTGKDAIRIRLIDKSRVAGVLRPIVHVTPPPVVTPKPTTYTPPQGAMTIPTGNEQYEVKTVIPGYLDSNSAANHLKKAVDIQPATYYVFSKRQTGVGVMIHITKEPGKYGAWINPADNVVFVPPAPVVEERTPVPIVSNVVVVPNSSSVQADISVPVTPVVQPVAAPEEVSTMPTPEPVKVPDWRSTYVPFDDPRGYRRYVYYGEPTVITDLAGEKKSTKQITEGKVLKFSGEVMKDNQWYIRVDKSEKPEQYAYSWHALPVVDENGVDNFGLPKEEQAANRDALNIGVVAISKLLQGLANFFDMLNDKINKKGTK